jgi:hypothetical protein
MLETQTATFFSGLSSDVLVRIFLDDKSEEERAGIAWAFEHVREALRCANNGADAVKLGLALTRGSCAAHCWRWAFI